MNDANTIKKLRNFGFIVGTIFPILLGWIIPTIIGEIFKSWTLLVGLPLIFLAIFSPRSLKYPHDFWISFGHYLSIINSHIILGIIYIFIMLPTSFMMKLIGYDPLRKRKSKLNSYKEIKEFSEIDLKRIF